MFKEMQKKDIVVYFGKCTVEKICLEPDLFRANTR